MENRNVGLSRKQIIILPLIYELSQLRRQYAGYYVLVIIVQILFLFNTISEHTLTEVDQLLKYIQEIYHNYFIMSQPLVYAITYAAFLFTAFIIITVIYLSLLSALKQSILEQTRYEQKLKHIIVMVYFIGEIVVTPAVVILANNIKLNLNLSVQVISYFSLPVLAVLLFVDRKRRIMQFYQVIICCLDIFVAENIMIVVFGIVILKLVMNRNHIFMREIIYIVVGLTYFINLTCLLLKQTICIFYYCFIIVTIVIAFLFLPRIRNYTNHIQQNQIILNVVQKLTNQWKVSHVQRMEVVEIVNNFQQLLTNNQTYNLGKSTVKDINEFTVDFNRLQCLAILEDKLKAEDKREPSNDLKVQSIYLQMHLNKFSMSLLYQIQKLVQKMKLQSTFDQRYRLFELVNRVQRKYLRKDESINASIIIMIQKKIQTFYSNIMNITILMLQFWKLQKKKHLTQNIIFLTFQKIDQLQNSTSSLISEITSYSNTKMQSIVYQYIIGLINNNYHFKTITSSTKPKPIITITSCNYILIEQNSILDMSNQLLNQFHLRKEQIVGFHITDIFPSIICRFIAQHLDSIIQQEIQNEEATTILPMKISREHTYIQPFNTSIQILPDLVNGIKYIINFQHSEQIQEIPSFLYSSNYDHILGTSKSFSSYFKLQYQSYILQQFAHQLFGIDIMQTYNSRTKEDEPIYCQFYIKHSTLKITPRVNKQTIPIVLKVIKSYGINDQNLLLIQILKKEEYDHKYYLNKKSKTKIMDMKQYSQTQNNTIKQKDINEVFCKITNPYQNVIEEKLSKINQFSRISYLKLIIFMFFIIICAVGITNILLMLQVDQTATDLVDVYNQNMYKNNQITNTFVLFSQSSILHQFLFYPQQYLQLKAYNMTAQIIEYVGRITGDIDIIRDIQLKTISRRSQTYNLMFQNFNLTSDTHSSNIFDYLYQAKQSLVTKNISFLVRNWPNIIKIINSFQKFNLKSIDQLIDYQFSVFMGTCTVIFTTMIIVGFVSIRIRCLINRILDLYQGINAENSQKFINNFKQFADVMYNCKYFRGVKQSKQNKLLFSNDGNLTEEMKERNNLQYLKQSIDFNIDVELYQSAIDIKQEKQKSEVINQIKKNNFIVFLCKQNILCGFPILVTIFFTIYYFQIQQYKSESTNIMNYSDSLQNTCNFISYQASSYFMAGLQQILPENQRVALQLQQQRQLITSFDVSLPIYFSSYKKAEFNMLNYDLCSFSFLNTGSLYKGIQCSKILGGIMTVGFAQTINMYVSLIKDHIGLQMKQFGNVYRISATYPVFMQILYLRRTIYNMIIYLQGNFNKLTYEYITIWNNFLKLILKLGWFLLPLIIGFAIFYFHRSYKRCRLGLKCFFILPKTFLLQMKVTKILRQKQILDQIEWLAL